jgi:hypothetical protein
MPRRRRQGSRLPQGHIRPQGEVDRAPLDHDIAVRQPILRPCFPIDLDALHVGSLIQPGRGDAQRPVPVDRDVDVLEPRRRDQKHVLRDHRVDAKQLPQQPGVHGAGVAVPRDSVVCVFETVGVVCPMSVI